MRNTTRKLEAIEWQQGKLVRTPVEVQSTSVSHFRRWLLVTLLIMFLLGSTTLVVWRTSSWLSSTDISKTGPQKVPVEPGVSKGDQDKAQAVTQGYMTDLLQHSYDGMWTMLQPEVRAQWPGEKAFADYWRLRFQHYILQGFTLGNAKNLSRWVDPETMRAYTQVIELPVSLHLQPDQTLQQQQALLTPEALHPDRVFHDLPFIILPTPDQQQDAAQWRILDGGPADLEAPILPPLQAIKHSVQVPIMMYHHISAATPPNLLELSLTVTPTHFQAQLAYLKEHNYHTITFNQLFAALYYDGPLPPHPIILTFDDGYRDAYQFALPLLQAYNFSGMFYIITGKVGQPDYMDWDQVRALQAAGMQIGSHTVHHVSLGWIIIGTPQVVQRELQQSQAVLQKQLNIPIQQFCYPSGEPFRNGTPLMQQRITTMLAGDGYVGATTDPGQTGIIQSSEAPFDLLRIRVDGRETQFNFINSLPKVTSPPSAS